MEDSSNLVAARSFARSLNILLKTVRLYGAEHERTTALLESAWVDLRAALKHSGESGLLLGVSGNQVLLDGVPLEKRPTDRSFAQLLNSAGLASINFSHRVTVDDFWRFVSAFSSRSPKAGPLATELRVMLGGDKGSIKVNEVRFIAHDASVADATMAAELAARSLGADAQRLQGWLKEPQRLLQLIAAAEGARSGGPSAGGAGGAAGGSAGGPAGGSAVGTAVTPGAPVLAAPPVQENDVFQIFQWLAQLGQTADHPDSSDQISAVEKDLHQLPKQGQAALAQALMSMSSQSEPLRPDDPMLLQLAERVAIRFALERYQHGDVKTNAVVELLDRLKREIGSLRNILKVHEQKMGEAGMDVESHAEILDRQFWARVPAKQKRKMLLSPEAWAVPPRNIRQYVEEVMTGGDIATARSILDNYAQSVHSDDVDARRKASAGLTEMADLFSKANHSLLKSTLHHMGEAMSREGNADLQTLMGASFVRFSHEAAARRQYPAVHEALQAMEVLEQRQPGLARLLWPRVKVGNPLPEFIEEALREPHLPEGLAEVLRRMPHATVDHVASRIQRCARRDEWERMLAMVDSVGPEAIAHLGKIVQTRPAPEAASKIALLTRLGPRVLEELLPGRLPNWDPSAHDLVVRQLANSLSPERGRLIEKVYDLLNKNVLPEAVDELGMSGDSEISPRLIRIVERETAQPTEPYLQIKAIEALGRLRESKAESLLRPLAESKRLWRWLHPRELRITAMQALQKIDPEWTAHFLPKCGLNEAELHLTALDPDPHTPWLRQRRYVRVNLPAPLKGAVHAGQGLHQVAVQQLSLGGGVAKSQCHLKPGSTVPLEFKPGMSNIHAKVLVREARPQELTFEFVELAHEDRGRLRRPLVGLQARDN
jgi:hypothetical protein